MNKQRQGLVGKETAYQLFPKYSCGEDCHSLFDISNKTQPFDWSEAQSPGFLFVLPIRDFWQDFSLFGPHFAFFTFQTKELNTGFFFFQFEYFITSQDMSNGYSQDGTPPQSYSLNKTKQKILFWPISNCFCCYSRNANNMISISTLFYLIYSVLFISKNKYSFPHYIAVLFFPRTNIHFLTTLSSTLFCSCVIPRNPLRAGTGTLHPWCQAQSRH